jgi:predicted dehydrogenase
VLLEHPVQPVGAPALAPRNGHLRLGLVGCGAIVRKAHLPAIMANPDVRVGALCDRDQATAALTASEFDLSCPIITSVKDLVGKVDAAIVAAPPRWHAPLTLELLAAGIDVLCEKPLAITVHDGAEMAAAALRHQRVLAVALMMRYFPQNQVLRQLVADGELGEVREVVAEDGAALDWGMAANSYFDRANTGGGVLFDTGVHTLDRVLWLFGPLSAVGYEDDSFGGFESNARLTGELQIEGRRVPARLEFSWSHPLPRSIKVIGSEATAEAFITDPRTLTLTRRTRSGALTMVVQCADAWSPDGHYRAQLADFVQAVRLRRAPFVSASDALASLTVIEEAYRVRTPLPQPWLARRVARE